MDEERKSSDEPLPGSVSNQNQEEAEPGHGGGERRDPDSASEQSSGSGDSGGESSEGSQSTGNPDSAG